MKALFMISPYINQILDGVKIFDARSYDTWTRGTIALVQSKSNLLLGTIEIVDTKEITFQEYMEWHDERYEAYYCIPPEENKNKKYYAWIMKNPNWLDKPIKVERPPRKQWIDVDL